MHEYLLGRHGLLGIIVRNDNKAANLAYTPLPAAAEADPADDFRKASLALEAAARVRLFADLKMEALDAAAGTVLDLNGQTFTVRTAAVGGVNVPPSSYTAAQLADLGFDEVIDTADGAGGMLRVLGAATLLTVR